MCFTRAMIISYYLPGIVISEPYGNDSKTEISAAPVIINSLTPTAVRPPTGIKNCSNGDVEVRPTILLCPIIPTNRAICLLLFQMLKEFGKKDKQ